MSETCMCPTRQVLADLRETLAVIPAMQDRVYLPLGMRVNNALAAPCPCADLLVQEGILQGTIGRMQDTIDQLRAQVAELGMWTWR